MILIIRSNVSSNVESILLMMIDIIL